MDNSTLFTVVVYTLLVGSVIDLIFVSFLFIRDCVLQEPRFGVALKWLGASLVLGLLILAANTIAPWIVFYTIGMTLAGVPALILLFVTGNLLLEAGKSNAGITFAVLGGFGGVLFAILLLIIKTYLLKV